jgi:hypothetical protein
MDSVGEDLATKGMQALSLTRTDSDASVMQLLPITPPVLRSAVNTATDIS